MARKNKISKFKVTSKIEKFFSNSSATLINTRKLESKGISRWTFHRISQAMKVSQERKKNSVKMFYLLPEKTKS